MQHAPATGEGGCRRPWRAPSSLLCKRGSYSTLHPAGGPWGGSAQDGGMWGGLPGGGSPAAAAPMLHCGLRCILAEKGHIGSQPLPGARPTVTGASGITRPSSVQEGDGEERNLVPRALASTRLPPVQGLATSCGLLEALSSGLSSLLLPMGSSLSPGGFEEQETGCEGGRGGWGRLRPGGRGRREAPPAPLVLPSARPSLCQPSAPTPTRPGTAPRALSWLKAPAHLPAPEGRGPGGRSPCLARLPLSARRRFPHPGRVPTPRGSDSPPSPASRWNPVGLPAQGGCWLVRAGDGASVASSVRWGCCALPALTEELERVPTAPCPGGPLRGLSLLHWLPLAPGPAPGEPEPRPAGQRGSAARPASGPWPPPAAHF